MEVNLYSELYSTCAVFCAKFKHELVLLKVSFHEKKTFEIPQIREFKKHSYSC